MFAVVLISLCPSHISLSISSCLLDLVFVLLYCLEHSQSIR